MELSPCPDALHFEYSECCGERISHGLLSITADGLRKQRWWCWVENIIQYLVTDEVG